MISRPVTLCWQRVNQFFLVELPFICRALDKGASTGNLNSAGNRTPDLPDNEENALTTRLASWWGILPSLEYVLVITSVISRYHRDQHSVHKVLIATNKTASTCSSLQDRTMTAPRPKSLLLSHYHPWISIVVPFYSYCWAYIYLNFNFIFISFINLIWSSILY